MWFYTVIFIVLLIINGLGYLYRIPKIAYIGTLFFLMIIAAFRPSTCCADYTIYIEYYENLNNIPLSFLEPTFFAISFLSQHFFDSYVGVFLLYSILGVTLKGVGIVQLTPYYLLTSLIYFASYFLLHEMTQIRVGVSSAFLLLSIPYIQEKNKTKFFCCVIIGCLFHYSLIVFLPFYFLDANFVNKRVYILTIFITFFLTIVGVNFITFIQLIKLGFLSDKIAIYQALLDDGIFGDIKLLNPLLFLRIIMAIFFICKSDILSTKNKYTVIITKIYVFSILAFIGLSPLPVLAGRISQLLGVVEMILIPFFVYLIKPQRVAVAMVIMFAIMILYKQLYYSSLMSAYIN